MAYESLKEAVHQANLDLVEAGVVTVPGATFGQPGYLRLGFGVERATLEAGLDRIGSVIDRRGAN
jgi:aspartate/methionine/tyrosine aminotransferase